MFFCWGHFGAFLRSFGLRKIPPHRGRILWAQGTLLTLGTYLLITADSVTSKVSFAVGTILMLATSSRFIRRHTAAIHALVLLLVVAVSFPLFLAGGAGAAQALGRTRPLAGVETSGRLLSGWRPTLWLDRGLKVSGAEVRARNWLNRLGSRSQRGS